MARRISPFSPYFLCVSSFFASVLFISDSDSGSSSENESEDAKVSTLWNSVFISIVFG
uniref:Uncharacterized protein n=1 Tax=Rhizophora mucronata TaxID=61149 RepID=A0A2P2NPF8_RHIMU